MLDQILLILDIVLVALIFTTGARNLKNGQIQKNNYQALWITALGLIVRLIVIDISKFT